MQYYESKNQTSYVYKGSRITKFTRDGIYEGCLIKIITARTMSSIEFSNFFEELSITFLNDCIHHRILEGVNVLEKDK